MATARTLLPSEGTFTVPGDTHPLDGASEQRRSAITPGTMHSEPFQHNTGRPVAYDSVINAPTLRAVDEAEAEKSIARGQDPQRPVTATSVQADGDIDMETESISNQDVSDAESADPPNAERPKKKIKGQRFYCTGYPPCSLSFTRSEHLARHIRYVARSHVRILSLQ